MAFSPAQLQANRQNALRSTGPKTEEGKAVSRLNAFRHGLAGEGTLLAPDEDPRQVARRAKSFASELGAIGEVGDLLAHRAALLSIRMERSAERNFVVIASNQRAARDRFDQDRIDDLQGWIENLDDPSTYHSARQVLEAIPEGVTHLIASWLKLRDEILADDGPASFQATLRVAERLGLTDDETEALEEGETTRIDAEVERLRSKTTEFAEVTRAIAIERDRAGIIGGFDPSPEATLARRYEAAAERGMYRAIRAIAEIRRSHQADLSPMVPALPPLILPQSARNLELPTAAQTGLASFRAGAPTAESALNSSFLDHLDPLDLAIERRKKRPDLRKLAVSRR